MNATFGVKESVLFIEKPASADLLAKLRTKLEEYKKRIEEKEKGWGWTIDAVYKALILESLLDLPENGKISFEEIQKEAWGELVNGKMNVVAATHAKVLPEAWMVIYGYVYEPDKVSGGTGLPTT